MRPSGCWTCWTIINARPSTGAADGGETPLGFPEAGADLDLIELVRAERCEGRRLPIHPVIDVDDLAVCGKASIQITSWSPSFFPILSEYFAD